MRWVADCGSPALNSNMEDDRLSDLPPNIVESILTRLPIREAVKTSILSRSWRYKWASLTKLVFDDNCVDSLGDFTKDIFVNFVTRCLFLHQGPIHMFKLSTSYLQYVPDIDQWILFLSRNDIKELVLELGEGEWFRVPSCLFNCSKLTRLELVNCELDPPPTFKGFPNLRILTLHQVLVAADAIESLISSCPVLENLSLSYFDSLAMTISAPNLKYLNLEGEFKDICLENTPALVALSVAMYMTDDIAEHFEQSSSCKFVKFLGGTPLLEHLIGQIYFTKYLSIGDYPATFSITYDRLKVIELYQVSFEDMKEILVVLRLITSSPNLRELTISVSFDGTLYNVIERSLFYDFLSLLQGSSNTVASAVVTTDLDFWEEECPSDCTFGQLKSVKMTDLSCVPHELEFIKFILRNSPILETMRVSPSSYVKDKTVNMLMQLVRFRRASAQAELIFEHE
ncbi:F-box/FBD/LRR-repeat protein At1g13570 isoform X2 [Punica granatum]|uniref:F-box/FBD/LRR-repeat protein At1g13570 isoform X2 n=1 Tax=Punica granatum TaxID=22663 RepID=A0A6P8D538_PUNGR|nr:F-box/FBD/LRR-repeat protein At1g13570 isoform X2 [Punica granatum]